MAASVSNSQQAAPFRRTALLCWLGWVFDFYDLILIAFLIPAIEKTFHLDVTAGVWLLGIGLGASGLGGIGFGWLADKWGRKRVLTITVCLFSVGMLLTGMSQTVWQFLAARFITGLGLGGEWAVGHALIAESVPAEKRARWSAFLQSGEPVGVALAAVVGFMIAPHVGWRAVLMASSLTAVLAIAFRQGLTESPLWEIRKQEAKALPPLLPFLRMNGTCMFFAFIMVVCKAGTYWTCYTWLPRFLMQSGMGLGRSAAWFLCGQAGQFVGMYAFGWVADRIGRRWSFTVFSLLTASALLPLAFFWHDLIAHHRTAFWLLLTLLGFGSGCTAGFGALLSELFPTARRTFAMGTVYNSARGVQLFAPVLVGIAVAQWGLKGGLLVPASLALMTAIWVWTLPERCGSSLKEI